MGSAFLFYMLLSFTSCLIIIYFFPSGAYRIVIFQHVINEIRTFRSKIKLEKTREI